MIADEIRIINFLDRSCYLKLVYRNFMQVVFIQSQKTFARFLDLKGEKRIHERRKSFFSTLDNTSLPHSAQMMRLRLENLSIEEESEKNFLSRAEFLYYQKRKTQEMIKILVEIYAAQSINGNFDFFKPVNCKRFLELMI